MRGPIIDRGDVRDEAVFSESVSASSAGDYRCVATREATVVAVRNFTIIVNPTTGDNSSSIFRFSAPAGLVNNSNDDIAEIINALVLGFISEDFEGVQEVNCSVVE
jgi:hypothetical protein